jgi:cytochrome c
LSKLCKPQTLAAVLSALALLVVGSNRFADSQSTESGKEVFEKRCGGCHALDRDKEGPRLRGVYGRVAGSVDSFQYSEALKKSMITWTDVTLDQWLSDTEKLVPGNDMTFHVEKAAERTEIIAYLKQTLDKQR